jgi:hypothetical protein
MAGNCVDSSETQTSNERGNMPTLWYRAPSHELEVSWIYLSFKSLKWASGEREFNSEEGANGEKEVSDRKEFT